MKKLTIFLLLILAFPLLLSAQEIDPTKTVGTNGADYPTLNDAFYDINSGIIQGRVDSFIPGYETEKP